MEDNELIKDSTSISKYLIFIFIFIFCFIFIGYRSISHASIRSPMNYQNNISSSHSPPSIKSTLTFNITSPEHTLVVYVFGKTHQVAEENLAFFIRTAVYDSDNIDYYFILQQINNEHFDEKKLPLLPPNAHYIQHENKCYDIGTIGWFLSKNYIDRTKYKYFIFINSSVRGPFIVSYYLDSRWYTIFTNRLNDHIKLVGCTINCEVNPHVQSYFWALDFKGLDLLLKEGTVFACHENMGQTIYRGEIGASRIILKSGFGIDSLMKKYENMDFRLEKNKNCNNIKNPTYAGVDGISLDPFEVVFVKIKDQMTQYKYNRGLVGVYEKWIDTKMNRSSINPKSQDQNSSTHR